MNKHQTIKIETEQVWRELSDRLRQFVRSRVYSQSDVDDVLQNVFLRIHSSLENLKDANRLESWVFQITRNTISDFYRRKRDDSNEVETLVDTAADNAEQNVTIELSGCLDSFVKQLPDDQYRAVALYEFEQLAQKEIAKREGISLSGVKSRIQRGRKALKKMLKECCEFQMDQSGNIIDYEQNQPGCCNKDCK